MLSALNDTQKGLLIALSGFAAFSCADACAKWLGMRYDTFPVIFWTYVFALVFGLLAAPWLGGLGRTLRTGRLWIHVARGFCALAIAGLAVSALGRGLPLTDFYTILFLAPFVITIAARFFYGEAVPLRNWGIIALGFSGVVVAFRPGLAAIPPEALYAFGALAFVAGVNLLARPLKERESLLSLSFYPALVIVAVLGAVLWPVLSLPSAAHLPVFMLNGACVVAGISGTDHAVRIAPYGAVAPLRYAQMVFALVIGFFVFGDVPDVWMMAGAGIIIASGLMLARGR